MYLIDSNIWLEYLFNQENDNDCIKFLTLIEDSQTYISDFTLFSIGITTTRGNKTKLYEDFIVDVFETGGVNLLSLYINDHKNLFQNMNTYNLDFDDAYKLTCANKYNLTLISFDSDFDNSPLKRKVPKDFF